MNKGTTRTYHYKDIKAMKLNIIALLLFLVLAVNSRLILPDMDMILNSDLPSSAYGGKSQCDTYSIKLGLKLAKLVWDVLNLSLIHICRCRRIERCRSRWSPYH
eukprot:TRINITY_DN12936_c0_g1_i1.p1 TRINITY_DN12936_c0_g1~~TRINITY_DN12936_c0_g1_i1.p1  ORF type:complete len:104 (-),score=19.95 TRINITY_DN12936_c0_g1_i1:11-322(-)